MSIRLVSAFAFVFTVSSLVARPSSAEVLSVLLREGDPLPEFAPLATIDRIGDPQANAVGGWFVDLHLETAPDEFTYCLWGTFDDSPPSVLRELMTIGTLNQVAFGSFGGGRGHMTDDGHLVYASSSEDGGPVISPPPLFRDDSPAAVKGQPHPRAPGMWWTDWGKVLGTCSRSSTRDGKPLFLGSISDAPNGFPMPGIYVGEYPDPIIAVEQIIPPFFVPVIEMAGAGGEISGNGQHSLVKVGLPGGPSPNTPFLDGAAIVIDGLPIRRGFPSPPSLGGEGWPWLFLGDAGVSDAGDWFLQTGFDGPSTDIEIILRNGDVFLRMGDEVLPNRFLQDIEAARMNDDGDLLVLCDVGIDHLLLLNGEVVASIGDPVDIDGDGNAEPDAYLEEIDYRSVTLSPRDASGRVRILFSGDYQRFKDIRAALFRMTTPIVAVGGPANVDGHLARWLAPPAPNPFSERTRVEFEIPQSSPIRLSVYDVTGRQLATLANGVLPAGSHRVSWNGHTDGGASVPSGVYFVRFESASGVDSRRIVRVTSTHGKGGVR